MRWVFSKRRAQAAPATALEPQPLTRQPETAPIVGLGNFRETINLLESDLGAFIRQVQRACSLVHREAEDSSAATDRITQRTNHLVAQSGTASRDLMQLAAATEQLARSSDQIGEQVGKADELAGEANESAALARPCIVALD